ncbi:MAG: threonine synthase [Ignavibacteriaceae bacterium]|nr:threonine synthase [Ignavibacteriaceae bacterium]
MFISTNNKKIKFSFKDAVTKGMPADNGLFMPEEIKPLGEKFWQQLNQMNFAEIALAIISNLIDDEIPRDELKKIVEETFNFDAPLVELSEDTFVLELFHGPTFAFKDFGARFMASALNYFNETSKKKITVLAATSGDTGSAVAHSFLGSKYVDVVLLYPSGKVSKIQEQQLTTLGQNITALEIEGTFDDCQKLVKTAFVDDELNKTMSLSSANSINIARLIPQSLYYVYAYSKFNRAEIIFSVPSGNLGNLTGGLIAKKLGLPVKIFIAANNRNNVFEQFVNTGEYLPRASIKTISNAMDVGDPSNIKRILHLYESNHQKIKDDICAYSFGDDEILEAIRNVAKSYNYIFDPHTACGFLALQKYLSVNKTANAIKIILSTAHPAKFLDVFDEKLKEKIETPVQLKETLRLEKTSIKMSSDYFDFKNYLLSKKLS